MERKNLFLEIRDIFSYMKDYSKEQKSFLILMSAFTIFRLTDPIFLKILIDEFFLGRDYHVFYTIAFLYIAKTVIQNIIFISSEYVSNYISLFVSVRFRNKIFKKILRIKGENIKDLNIGEFIVSFDKNMRVIDESLSKAIFENILRVSKLLGISIFMIILSPMYYLFSLLLIPLRVCVNSFFLKREMEKTDEVFNSTSEIFDYLNEIFNGYRAIKLSGKEKYMEKRFIKKKKDLLEKSFENHTIKWKAFVFDNLLLEFDKIIIYALSGYLLFQHKISFGTFLALSAYDKLFKEGIKEIIESIHEDLTKLIIALKRLEKFINLEEETSKGMRLPKIRGNINLRDISFKYGENGNEIFNNFNLEIKEGEKVTIVGESGSGKSTLINLILGVYKPIKGEVLLDGVNISNELDIRDYRKKVGLVMQDNFFFSDSLRENLTLGEMKDEIEISKFMEAVKMSEFAGENLNTHLDNPYVNLSEGQRQRLALARMLLKNPELVILDESSSGLDNITEKEIQTFLKEELREKTVIKIAHKLTAIDETDRIIVMKSGEIIEEGTHERLMENRSYYYQLLSRKN